MILKKHSSEGAEKMEMFTNPFLMIRNMGNIRERLLMSFFMVTINSVFVLDI